MIKQPEAFDDFGEVLLAFRIVYGERGDWRGCYSCFLSMMFEAERFETTTCIYDQYRFQ